MKCQMLCGRCSSPASLVLDTTGKYVDLLNMATLELIKVKSKRRRIYACRKHRRQIEESAGYYGGVVRSLTTAGAAGGAGTKAH